MIRAFHCSDGMHGSGFLLLFQILFSIYIVPNHSVYTAYRVDGPWALIVLEYENNCTPDKIEWIGRVMLPTSEGMQDVRN